MKKNSRGFSVVEVGLILVIVGIIGGIIWYVIYANKNIDDTNIATAKSSASTPGKAKKVTSPPTQTKEPTQHSVVAVKTTTTQTVNGVSFELPNSMGTLLTWARTPEINNISSSTLLNKEKELYGTSETDCTENGYALGSITVKSDATPYPGEALIKKLDSGKYLFYSDDAYAKNSFCYKNRDKLHDLIDQQVQSIKDGLKDAQ